MTMNIYNSCNKYSYYNNVGKLLYWNYDKNMVGLCKNNKLIISDITIKEIRQG